MSVVCDVYTHVLTLTILQWVIISHSDVFTVLVSHDMHVTPSSLQVVTLPSAVEAGLSKCTALQKLTVRESPPSVTAALLKAVTVIRSLEEVTLRTCDFGM